MIGQPQLTADMVAGLATTPDTGKPGSTAQAGDPQAGEAAPQAGFALLMALLGTAAPPPASAPDGSPTGLTGSSDLAAALAAIGPGTPPQTEQPLVPAGRNLPPDGMQLPPRPDFRSELAVSADLPQKDPTRIEPQATAPAAVVATLPDVKGQRLPFRVLLPPAPAPADSAKLTVAFDPRGGSPAPASYAHSVIQAPVPTTAGQPVFDQAVGQRLIWMVQQSKHDAQIKVEPEHLGSIDIHLNLDGDDARISLSSPHAPVRDALEAAIPRLRAMLTDVGLGLAHLDVGTGDAWSAQRFDQGTGTQQPSVWAPGSVSGDNLDVQRLHLPSGIVDVFA